MNQAAGHQGGGRVGQQWLGRPGRHQGDDAAPRGERTRKRVGACDERGRRAQPPLRVLDATLSGWLKELETVHSDTEASAATSFMVGPPRGERRRAMGVAPL